MRRLVLVTLSLMAFGGCFLRLGETSSPPARPCGTPSPPTVPPPSLPDGIPSPAAVVYTSVSQDPASLQAEGYASGSVDEVVEAYRSAFDGRSLLTLGWQTQGDHASLTIGGPSTEGSVELTRLCDDRVGVELELRPLTGS